jgi:hypothetical protein
MFALPRPGICRFALVVFAAIACSEDSTVQPVQVATVSLGAPEALLSMRQPRLLVASFRDASGNVMNNVIPAWTSSDNAVVSVDQNGNLFGVALGGPVTITVTADGKSASTPVTVVPARIDITPGEATLVLGTTRQLSGTPVDFEGAPIIGAGAVTWISSNPATISVGSTTGFVSTVAAGSAVITASAAGRTTPLSLETGVPTTLDGQWTGTTSTTGGVPRTFPVAFEVVFGSVRSFRLTFGSNDGPCPLQLIASSVGATPIINGAFEVSIVPPPRTGATPSTVSASFTSAAALTATHTDFRFGPYPGCPNPGGGTSSILTDIGPGTISASRQ